MMVFFCNVCGVARTTHTNCVNCTLKPGVYILDLRTDAMKIKSLEERVDRLEILVADLLRWKNDD